ncbi:hypothetical protein [Nitrosomonas sp. ANs5]|uniref:hypothetical protein n=1 Tax=Nitrosomonas sp. ANs5 TaxID=3423941 RepID=UPI003D32970E
MSRFRFDNPSNPSHRFVVRQCIGAWLRAVAQCACHACRLPVRRMAIIAAVGLNRQTSWEIGVEAGNDHAVRPGNGMKWVEITGNFYIGFTYILYVKPQVWTNALPLR